jgi:uncharacterized protein (TIGR02118 family)
MFKVVFLIKRRPDLPVGEFQERWKSEHGPRLAGLPGLRRYVQSLALTQGYARGNLLYDGLDELWFDDEAGYGEALASRAFAPADEAASALSDVSRRVAMPVDVHVMKDGPIPEGGVKNIEFVNRRPGMALEPFRKYWREVHGPIATRIPPLLRYEQNHLRLSEYDRSEPPYDGLAITWFESTSAMRDGTKTEEYAVTRADEANFLPDGHLPIIITREHVVRS